MLKTLTIRQNVPDFRSYISTDMIIPIMFTRLEIRVPQDINLKAFMKKLMILLFICVMISCSREHSPDINKDEDSKASGRSVNTTVRTPASDRIISIEITPLEANRNSTLNLTAKGFNFHEAEIEWFVNGYPAAHEGMFDKFKTLETKIGDTVQAQAVVGEVVLLSNKVRIDNTPPELKRVKIMPEVFKPGDRLYIEVEGSDIDGDDVSIDFEWTKNGELSGKKREIDSSISRGDKIFVKVTPFDGEIYGKPITLNREIRNVPPIINEDKKFVFDGKSYSYHIKATDPDGDDLTYSLKTGPEGLTIDSSGLIRWDVPRDFKGRAPVSVSVSDGNGGESVASFNIDITAEK